ncbi:DUF4145 domain-containing protein [Burkholderia vietnamiensis]|uniref:DUF4145 domain-containing protein n=1 Tax=Burkholderia vietnamiensis TaxID=60552 RepID=UPI00264A8E54|nr:DUF4145 domain-containing protein [Burkholderia vietnamiensis]MDN8065922.1 DUF4145 domain-containing protein [Burkholderia vietnamiensis]
MECPHCTVEIHPSFEEQRINGGGNWWNKVGEHQWSVVYMTCPACSDAIIYIHGKAAEEVGPLLAYPKTTGRSPAPNEVPGHIAEDYHEACAVVESSPKASAALSRRCLQLILRENGFAQKDLAPAIQALLDSKTLPSALADNVDAIRNIGNFAAHPMKDTSSGQILPVEPHEAEWNLDVLEELFDFFYVQPEKARQRRAALDAKLAAAGKPPMK